MAKTATKDQLQEGHRLRRLIQIVGRPKVADENVVQYDDNGLPQTIEVIRTGTWRYAFSEPVVVTTEDLHMFVANFDAGIRKGLPIDCDHDFGAAMGWIKKVYVSSDGQCLNGDVEWTTEGARLLSEKIYKFFSPEWYDVYQDPETGSVTKNVLMGGALTNRPLMKQLMALVAGEGKPEHLTNSVEENTVYLQGENKASETNDKEEDKKTMNLDEIRAKAKADLTTEEAAFLTEHSADLTDEERTTFGIEAPAAEGEGDGDGDSDEDGGEEGDGTPAGEPATAKEKTVSIKASELATLKKQAAEGAKAHGKLIAKEAEETVTGFLANDKGEGKFSPALKASLKDFYLTLSDKQALMFSELVKQMPDLKLFSELGSDQASANTAAEEVNRLVKEKMKANDKLEYAHAFSEVRAENPDLMKRYNAEITGESN